MPPATEFDPEARAAFQRWASTGRGLESHPGRVQCPGVTDDCDCPLSSVIQGYLGVDLRVVRETAAMTCLVNGLCTPRLGEIIFDMGSGSRPTDAVECPASRSQQLKLALIHSRSARANRFSGRTGALAVTYVDSGLGRRLVGRTEIVLRAARFASHQGICSVTAVLPRENLTH